MKNTLYYGDNLDILPEYIPDEIVDLIYLDELGIIWSIKGHFLKKPYRSNLNEASS